MFDLCKKVNVYNIENHYHFHCSPNDIESVKQKIGLHNLRVTPVTISSSVPHNKISQTFSSRKGLRLSDSLSQCETNLKSTEEGRSKKHKIGLESTKHKRFGINLTKQFTNFKQVQHSKPNKPLSVNLPFKQSPFNNFQLPKSNKRPYYTKHTYTHTQKLYSKQKPVKPRSIISTQSFPNKPLIETGYSTLAYQYIQNSKQYRNMQQTRHQKTNKSLSELSLHVRYQPSMCLSQVSNINNKQDYFNVDDFNFQISADNSRDNCSQSSNHINTINIKNANLNMNKVNFRDSYKNSINQHNQYEIKSNQLNQLIMEKIFSFEKQDSMPTKNTLEIPGGTNQRYQKLMTIQSNRASIILSEILSRQDQHQNTRTSQKRKLNLLWGDNDRHTIISIDEPCEQGSLRIQQSIICERNAINNFYELLKITQPMYTLSLAIEKNILCIVSIKQIHLSDMSLIAQEINNYGVLQNYSDLNFQAIQIILKLYQVQVSSDSYLLIKQPFSMQLKDLLTKKINNKQSISKDKQTLVQTCKDVVNFLQMLRMSPKRKLQLADFVEYAGTIKLQQLGIFQIKQPVFTIEQISDSLLDEINMIQKMQIY